MSEIEDRISRLARSGDLNHISLAHSPEHGWSASYRGVSDKDCRITHHPDPLAALLMALTGRKIPMPAPAAKPVRRRAADPQPAAPVAAQSGILDDL